MKIKTKVKRFICIVLCIVGSLFLLLACGVWPILLFMLLGSFAGVLWLLLHAAKPPRPIEPMQLPQQPKQKPAEQDLQALAWSVLIRRVTLLVMADYPDARWVWESPDANRRFEKGDPVFILLNRAGGHRRARVVIQNLQAAGLEYDLAPEQAAAQGSGP